MDCWKTLSTNNLLPHRQHRTELSSTSPLSVPQNRLISLYVSVLLGISVAEDYKTTNSVLTATLLLLLLPSFSSAVASCGTTAKDTTAAYSSSSPLPAFLESSHLFSFRPPLPASSHLLLEDSLLFYLPVGRTRLGLSLITVVVACFSFILGSLFP